MAGSAAKAKTAKDYVDEKHTGRVAFALVHRPGYAFHMGWSYSFPKTEILPNNAVLSKMDSETVEANGLGHYYCDMGQEKALWFIARGLKLMQERNLPGEAPIIIGPFFEDDPTMPKDTDFVRAIMLQVAKVMPKTDAEKAEASEQKAQKAEARNAALEAELAALRAEKTRLEALQAQRRQTTGTGTGSGTGSGRE
jgi:hypothetical protein